MFGAGPIGLGAYWRSSRWASNHVVVADLIAGTAGQGAQIGADAVINSADEDVLEAGSSSCTARARRCFPAEAGTDIYLDAAGAPAVIDTALAAAKTGARLGVVAVHKQPVPVELVNVMSNEITIVGSMGYPDEIFEVTKDLVANWEKICGDRQPHDSVRRTSTRRWRPLRHPAPPTRSSSPSNERSPRWRGISKPTLSTRSCWTGRTSSSARRSNRFDLAFPHLQFVPLNNKRRKVIDPLKEEVRRKGLWATHLGPELGGQGYGQLKLALLNEILGRSQWAPIVFGCQAPDTGNAEILAHYGTDEQKERYLRPLLDGELFSCYSMTEPHAGADPTLFKTTAVRDGDDWVINGWKFFSSNAKTASFLIVMVVTNPEVSAYQGMSMFLVPTDTPGVNIVRNIGLYGEAEGEGSHALIHYDNVRVPADAVLGGEGQAFVIAQTRLGGGRIHHAMRTIGMSRRALDMMCERALSRETQGSRLV